MDHSIQGYLKRMPTKMLEGALHTYLQGKLWQDNLYAVSMILSELERRYVPEETTPQQLQAWENYKRKIGAALDDDGNGA